MKVMQGTPSQLLFLPSMIAWAAKKLTSSKENSVCLVTLFLSPSLGARLS